MRRRGLIDLLPAVRSAFGAVSVALACVLLLAAGQARAQCATNGTNQTCTNPAGTTVSGGGTGINDNATLTLTNFGTVTGVANGIQAATGANVTNSGAISGGGSDGVHVNTGLAAVTNSGTITGALSGIFSSIGANVINSGTISGGINGIGGNTVNVTNSGTITGATSAGIISLNANVTNSGTISSNFIGINAPRTNVTNAGTISGSFVGIEAGNANITNSGTITGSAGIGGVTSPSTLVNSGAIIGTGGIAITFRFSHADTLTFLPGSNVEGAIQLGAGDSVNFGGGNFVYTFSGPNPLSTATVSAAAPFVVVGNQVAVVDPTPFALADRNLMDFTRGISGVLSSLGGTSALGGPLSSAFAPSEPGSFAARVEQTFASIPALAYADDQTMVFKAPTTVSADGRAIWARGFGGERTQEPNGALLGAHTTFLGGAVGFDMVARSDLRLGLFAGGGESRMSLNGNAGNTNTDTAFGGLYGRWSFVSLGHASFLDFALHGGSSTNTTSRTINSNVAPFMQVATASYDSSYFSSEAKYGIDLPLWRDYTLTPSFGLRYVAGFFGGYTEAGSAANLTVASRTVQDLEERGELKLTRATPIGPDLLLTSVHIGAIGLQRTGDSTVNAVLLGANLPFVTPGKNDVAGAVGGGGVEWRTREGVSVFGAAEAIGFSDQSAVWSARGGIRIAF